MRRPGFSFQALIIRDANSDRFFALGEAGIEVRGRDGYITTCGGQLGITGDPGAMVGPWLNHGGHGWAMVGITLVAGVEIKENKNTDELGTGLLELMLDVRRRSLEHM